ncbi:MAG TPA: 50S ribosomal protein L2 [Candidatus Dojkabacteria bacterium]|nr:50S ribosomal protein L2 [Candidatus Dojkabacteria bacterium]
MALKFYKPTTASKRHTVLVDRTGLKKGKPVKSLTVAKKSNAGRNNQGRITVRHRGGGVKRRIRILDFQRNKFGIPAVVKSIEYDPNRSANIALLLYKDGERRYMIAPEGLVVGSIVESGEKVDPVIGNSMYLENVPSGTSVCAVEVTPGGGAKLARSAGQRLVVRGGNGSGYAIVKMQSGEVRLLHNKCLATIGVVGNADHFNRSLGKAGTKRRLGWRPEVRGVAMHAEEHPHGAGEARNGIRMAKDIWGNRLGKKTRKNKKTEKFIISHRIAKRHANGLKN